ncbi:hypothetical protein EVAR_81847_1 [Eumeta japonica]|uniref:Uncharacterized protein n=1 Tax=Eumeta variegata TaxID=151549 RepID=A0A4C1XVC8_EUMVA|nr:hypothetical protein EVAR_81847_1 [Eumeta japonica]
MPSVPRGARRAGGRGCCIIVLVTIVFSSLHYQPVSLEALTSKCLNGKNQLKNGKLLIIVGSRPFPRHGVLIGVDFNREEWIKIFFELGFDQASYAMATSRRKEQKKLDCVFIRLQAFKTQ